jgi:hypothetical protein
VRLGQRPTRGSRSAGCGCHHALICAFRTKRLVRAVTCWTQDGIWTALRVVRPEALDAAHKVHRTTAAAMPLKEKRWEAGYKGTGRVTGFIIRSRVLASTARLTVILAPN